MKREKITKGMFGYTRYNRRKALIQTVLMFVASLMVFLIGLISTGNKLNLLTVIAILGMLPASKSLVGLIMAIKAKKTSDESFNIINNLIPEGISYDLYLTGYDKNFAISALKVASNSVCGFSEDEKTDEKKGEEHIRTYLSQNGLADATVKIYKDINKFMERAQQLSEKEITEKDEKILQVIYHLSI